MRDLLADLLAATTVDLDFPLPLHELNEIRAENVTDRILAGKAPCGERLAEEAPSCVRLLKINEDGVSGGCLACSRAGV